MKLERAHRENDTFTLFSLSLSMLFTWVHRQFSLGKQRPRSKRRFFVSSSGQKEGSLFVSHKNFIQSRASFTFHKQLPSLRGTTYYRANYRADRAVIELIERSKLELHSSTPLYIPS